MNYWICKLTCLFIILGILELNAQSIPVSERQVITELEERGISEQDMLSALAEKGINVDDLQDLTPSQILELEAIVKELEIQNQVVSSDPTKEVNKEEFLEEVTTQETEDLKEDLEEFADTKIDEAKTEIYGHSFFKNRDLSLFEKSSEVKAPDSYILGAGDKIVVSIWGLSQEEFAFEIDAEGYIVANSRRIYLKGLSLGEAKDKLESRLSRSYRFNPGEFDVAISYSRTINVNIQGEVSNPGGYTVSAINNAFNLLVAAEGPTRIGSLRDIMLIRKSGQIVNLDFYSYLTNPKSADNAFLEEGDVIVVPVSKKLVRIGGGVRRPMIYEIKGNEDLGDLTILAGGFSQDAKREFIQIVRYDNVTKVIIDVPSNQLQNFKLEDGDAVTVAKVESEAENFVTISGAVENPGTAERFNNMTLGNLINIGQFKSDARKDLGFLRRIKIDGSRVFIKVNLEEGSSDLNIPLIDGDLLNVFSKTTFNDNQRFAIAGAVRIPGSFQFQIEETISIKDAIELAGGLRRDASGIAIIHRKDPLNPKVKTYKRVNLADAYQDVESYRISALDSLEIFSKNLFDERSQVSIQGAVNQAGEFQYGENMTLGDVLTMAGGFQLAAATNKIEVSRLQIIENQPTKTVIANLTMDRDILGDGENLDFILNPYDEIIVRYVPEFELQQNVFLEGEVKYPGQYSLIKDNETVKDVISRAGGITVEAFPAGAKLYRSNENLGFVVIKLDEVLSSSNSKFNFKLKKGDRIVIPKSKDFVSISGATNVREAYTDEFIGEGNTLNVPFHTGKNAKFYIDNYAGGVSKNGSKRRVFVEAPNGQIERSKNYLLFQTYPKVAQGSKITVGTKEVKESKEREDKELNWTEVLQDAVAQAVSILTLILLIERI